MQNKKKAVDDVYPLDGAQLAWLRRGPNRRHIGVACRLPDCTALVPRPTSRLEHKHTRSTPTAATARAGRTVRGKQGRRQWFCCDDHAEQYRSRRRSLDQALHELDRLLAGADRSSSGQYTTETLRRLDRDRIYLAGIRRTYEAP